MKKNSVKTVSSVVEMIDIDEVENNRQALLDSDFHLEERKKLENRHVRSTAGVLALKQALCNLLQQTTGLTVEKKDFLISWSATGRPEIQSLPYCLHSSSFQPDNLFLSISHSREKAYGLAVYQESGNE